MRRYLLTQVDSQPQAVASRSRDHGPVACNRLAGNRGPSPRMRLIAGEHYVAFVSGDGPRVIWKATPASARLPAGLPALAASQRARTVTSLDGQAQLRLPAFGAGGGAVAAAAA